jgi:hypothetical protein
MFFSLCLPVWKQTERQTKEERKKGGEKEHAKKERRLGKRWTNVSKRMSPHTQPRMSLLLQTEFCKLFFILIEPEKINLKVFFGLSALSTENSVNWSIRIFEVTLV